MSITIIGCGWLGFPLGKELVNQGYLVRGSTRKEAGFEKLTDAGIDAFLQDLELSVLIPQKVLKSTEILIISIPPLHRSVPKKYEAILKQLLDQFSKETLVIFTSSTGIYPKLSGNFVESFKFNSLQDSTVLNLSEEVIRQSKKEHVIFRLGGLIGPNRHPIRFLQARRNVKNPDGPINFVHQGDCILAIVEAIENTEMRGTFNLVYPDHPTRKDYYFAAAEHYNLEAPVFSAEDSTQCLISSSKIIDEFSFEFKFPIDNYPQLDFS